MPSLELLSVKRQRPEVEEIAAVEDNFLITPLLLHLAGNVAVLDVVNSWF